MMKLLVANIPLPQNRFLVDLNASLGKQCALTHDEKLFWKKQGDFDVIHLHFPEYMTFRHEEEYEHGLTDQLIQETEDCLKFWGQKSKIVITRHVLLPHDALTNPQWEKMYEAVYRNVHGVAHFASASIDEFQNRYRHTQFALGPPQHAVIPHHNYTSLPNDITTNEARRRLGIGEKNQVMLVFGAIRNFEERELILRTFKKLKVKNKLLLVSRWKEKLAQVKWIRLKYWLRDLNRLYYRFHPSYKFNYGFVEEADTQLYLNAADVLFIPRLKVLNSGNVTLGMTFGKVVVGPDSWDVGQLLRETGNPVFNPDQPDTAVAATEKGFELAKQGVVGTSNRKLALEQWSADTCAKAYLDLMQQLTNRQ
jgi:glycosyltransferase involved in cell wall biosynthesis